MTETLHVYSQEAHHDNVHIAGDKDALIRLRNLIDLAIQDGTEGMNFFVNDGEGFTTYVHCFSPNMMDKLSTPYTADYAQDYRKFYPWQVP